MTQTSNSQTQTQMQNVYFCECLVNAKIPISLFCKLEARLKQHLQTKLPCEALPSDPLNLLKDDEVLAATIESLSIEHQNLPSDEFATTKIKVFLYKYPDSPNASERKLNLESDDGSLESLYTLESFPSTQNFGLWDALEFDSDIKASVLSYISAIFRFSLLGLADRPEISFNRLIFLHGPPGTGTTTAKFNTTITDFCRENLFGQGFSFQVGYSSLFPSKASLVLGNRSSNSRTTAILDNPLQSALLALVLRIRKISPENLRAHPSTRSG